jgi:hypothetical protein
MFYQEVHPMMFMCHSLGCSILKQVSVIARHEQPHSDKTIKTGILYRKCSSTNLLNVTQLSLGYGFPWRPQS